MNTNIHNTLIAEYTDVLEAVEQLKTVWQMCVEDRGTGEIRNEEALAIRWAENDFPFWNALTNHEVGTDRQGLARLLHQASQYMRERQKPGFLWLFDDLFTADARAFLPEAADDAGLSLALPGFGMAGDVLPLQDEPHDPQLEFVRVSTEEHVLAYGTLNMRAYGLPPECVHPGFHSSRIWKEKMFAYLGMKDGVPVTAAGTVAAGDCLFVIAVATHPDQERRGYGEAVTRKALYEGGKATGLKRATLHATMAGRPVYERIGLKTTASLGFYRLKG